MGKTPANFLCSAVGNDSVIERDLHQLAWSFEITWCD